MTRDQFHACRWISRSFDVVASTTLLTCHARAKTRAAATPRRARATRADARPDPMSDPDSSPTVDALTSLPPDILQRHVLARLEPWEVRVFARASRSCRALVLAADPSVRAAAAAPLPPARVLASPALVAWALENNLPRDHRAVESIAQGAPLDTLRFAYAHRGPLGLDHPVRWTRPVLRGAVRGGRVDVLEWARATFHSENTTWRDLHPSNPGTSPDDDDVALVDAAGELSVLAAEANDVVALRWIARRIRRLGDEDVHPTARAAADHHANRACVVAAKRGNVRALTWLLADDHDDDDDDEETNGGGCRRLCTSSAAVAASSEGHIDALRVLASRGVRLSSFAMEAAASRGRLDVVRWLISEGCPGAEHVATFAAKGGHSRVLEWARDAGLSWNRETCKAAAKGGHLEVLMWLRANGCPWDEWTVVYAERGGHPEVARWARENGCE